jgi:translation initiation factor 1 (eIF-1/SUI1)
MIIKPTEDPMLLFADFVDRMNTIQEASRKKEAKPEDLMVFSLDVQIEAEKARFGLELTKIQLMEYIATELKDMRTEFKTWARK